MLTQTLATFKTGQTFVGMTVENGNLVIGETRNEEAAQEGKFGTLLTVIPLQEAIAMAKALLAAQEDEDAAFDAHLEKEWERRQDYLMMEDDAIEHDYVWIAQGC